MTRTEIFKNTYETSSDEIIVEGEVIFNNTDDMFVILDGRGGKIVISEKGMEGLLQGIDNIQQKR